MAVVIIQNRRGSYNNFDPAKLKPGEFAVVQSNDPNSDDGKAVYIAIKASDVKQLAFYNDVENIFYNKSAELADSLITTFTEGVEDSVERAEAAAERAESYKLRLDNNGILSIS